MNKAIVGLMINALGFLTENTMNDKPLNSEFDPSSPFFAGNKLLENVTLNEIDIGIHSPLIHGTWLPVCIKK